MDAWRVTAVREDHSSVSLSTLDTDGPDVLVVLENHGPQYLMWAGLLDVDDVETLRDWLTDWLDRLERGWHRPTTR